jgi:chemotaxis signal transduction protein
MHDKEFTALDYARFITFHVDQELLGIEVDRVQEVLTARAIAPIPRAPAEIAGSASVSGPGPKVLLPRT